MADKRIRGTNTNLNTYEGLYDVLSKKPLFVQSDWEKSAKEGAIDAYSSALLNSDDINVEQYTKDYNLQYADNQTRISALYNEVGSNRTDLQKRVENVYNDDGTLKTTPDGKIITREFEETDYEYNKSLIKNKNDYYQTEITKQIQEEFKASRDGFEKAAFNIFSVIPSFARGFVEGVDDLLALSNGIKTMATDKDDSTSASDDFVSGISTGRYLQGVEDAIVDFESRYTSMRDVDGNYTNPGKYISGVASTLGMMAPSFLIGHGAGAGASALGASAKTAATVASVTSQVTFYAGMFSGSVYNMNEQFKMSGVSVPTSTIIANAAIKSALQWAVEVGLAKVLGGSAFDNIIFGRSVKTATGTSLKLAAGKRLLHDFNKEGLEEVFQDTSDFLVDKAFMTFIDEDFGDVTDLSWQSLMDSYIMGGVASFAGSAGNMLVIKRIKTLDVKTNKDGEVIKDKDGNPVFKKLDKVAAWEYGLDMQSYTKTFTEALNLKEKISKDGTAEDNKIFAEQILKLYGSYRLLTSIYGEIGEKRFTAANNILTKITENINSGKYNNDENVKALDVLKDSFKDAMNITKEDVLKDIKKANITKIVDKINKGEKIDSDTVSKTTAQKIDDMLGISSIESIVVSEDGNNIISAEGTVIVPEKMLEHASVEQMITTMAEQKLVKAIVKGKYKGEPVKIVHDVFKVFKNDNDATVEDAIYNLMFDDAFFRVCLRTSSTDVYKFLTSLLEIEKSVVSKTDRADIAYKAKLNKTFDDKSAALIEYAIDTGADYHYFTDMYSPSKRAAVIRHIELVRWSKNLYNRVISGEVLDNKDITILSNRVNSIPGVSISEKTTILNNVKSDNVVARESAMNWIDAKYNGVFTTNYNGKTYMPDTSIPNRIFNVFLQTQGLTIKNMLDENMLTESDIKLIKQDGPVDRHSIYNLRQTQFSKYNDKYVFTYNNNGKVTIFDDGVQVGYDIYKAQKDVPNNHIVTGEDIATRKGIIKSDDRTHMLKDTKRNNLVKDLLNENIDDATASYVSIDDVLTEPEMLKDNVKASIIKKYGTVNTYNAFLYLRDYYINTLKNTTIILLQNNTYAFGNIMPMKSLLKVDKVVINENTKVKDLIKTEHLIGGLKDINIKLVDGEDVASYSAYKRENINGRPVNLIDNTIYISKSIAEKGGDYLTFAFLHEFQHAVQYFNKMNLGIDYNWTKSIPPKVRKQIIAAVRKQRPELFVSIAVDSKKETQIVSNFVYDTSGESMAMGLDATSLIDFYPVLVNYDGKKTYITLPSGERFPIGNGPSMSLFVNTVTNGLTQILNEDKYAKYLDYSHDTTYLDEILSKSKGREYLSKIHKVQSVVDWVTAPMGLNKLNNYNKIHKKELYNSINSDTTLKENMLKVWYYDLGFKNENETNVTYEEFLKLDVPYVRVQIGDSIYDDYFVSAYSGFDVDMLISRIAMYSSNFNNLENLQTNDKYTLFVGTVKPEQAIGYVKTSLNETLLPTDIVKNADKYTVTISNNQINDVTPIVQISNDNVYAVEDASIDSTVLGPIDIMSLEQDNENVDDAENVGDDTIINDKKPRMEGAQRTKHKYTERIFKGYDSNGKPEYYYKYDANKKPRLVSNKNIKGTNLEYFKNPGIRLEISPELQNLIVHADGKNEIASVLQDKIDGDEAGTLKTPDVMDYFRDANKIDDVTFKVINNAYWQNKNIKTFEELETYVYKNTARYSAARDILTSSKYDYSGKMDMFDNPEVIERLIGILENDKDTKDVYHKLVESYYDSTLDISVKNLRILWMVHFDGTLETAGYLASVAKKAAKAKYVVTGETSTKVTKSLDASVSDNDSKNTSNSRTGYDTIGSYSEDFSSLAYSLSNDQKIEYLILKNSTDMLKNVKNVTYEDIKKSNFEKQTYYESITDEELNNIYIKLIVGEAGGVDLLLDNTFKTIDKEETKRKQKRVDSLGLDNYVRTSQTVKNNITAINRKILANIPKVQLNRFLKNNSEIFDENLKVKTALYQNVTAQGVIKLKNVDTLLELENTLKEIYKDAKNNIYASQSQVDLLKKAKEENAKLKSDYDNLKKSKNEKVVITINVKGEEIKINSGTNAEVGIPKIIQTLLATELNIAAKTDVKYLSDDNDIHIRMNIKTFIENNAEAINNLTQEEVDEVINYYLSTAIIPNTNRAKLYLTVEEILLTYILYGNKTNQLVLTSEQIDRIENHLNTIIGISGTGLAVWRRVMEKLNPEKIIIQSLGYSSGVEFDEFDVEHLIAAIHSGDLERIDEAKTNMYNHGLKNYQGHKKHYLDSILQFERAAMLSGPGTWVRNITSNFMITNLNKIAEQIGSKMLDTFYKMFPKDYKFMKSKQYRIIGVKPTKEVENFIKNTVNKSNLFDLMQDGLNKYNPAKNKEYTTDMIIAQTIAKSVKMDIIFNNSTKYKGLNKIYSFIYKRLSDAKSVKKAALIYFAKILTERKVDLTKTTVDGLFSQEVLEIFCESYRLASYEYMHKTNFITEMESKLRERLGVGAFFMYKQVFPFAGTSWNWFIEGLKFTPVGLVKSILNIAKFETNIDNKDNLAYKKSKGYIYGTKFGENFAKFLSKNNKSGKSINKIAAKILDYNKIDNVIERRERKNKFDKPTIENEYFDDAFTEYLNTKNLGKGVIGSIGLGIGIALVMAGFAGIDEEDDKYKLRVGDVRVDISDIFGTQGILLGIMLASKIKNKDKLIDIFSETLDNMFMDSTFSDVFNTVRYNRSLGDYMAYIPYNMLNMSIPNFIKVFSSVSNKYGVVYSSGVKGKIEKLLVQSIPFLANAFPHYIDPYTGEEQIAYKASFITSLVNKLTPLNIYPYNVSDVEKEAILLGIHKEPLTGNYVINDESIQLTSEEIQTLNLFYGKLNKSDFDNLYNDSTYYNVQKKDGSYTALKYSKMSDSEKATVIKRIMTNNSSLAKIYVLTSTKKYKYYATSDEYKKLKALGYTNIYVKDSVHSGLN